MKKYLNNVDLFSNVSTEGIIIHELGLITEVNNTLLKLFNISEKEIIGHHITEFFNTESQQIIVDHINRKSENPYDVKTDLAHGKNLDIELHPKNIAFDGHYLRCVLTKDITERKKNENKINSKNQLLTNLINNLPGIIYKCLLDEHWTMLRISNQCFDITGYTPEEFLYNKDITFAEIIHPEDAPYLEKVVLGSIKTNERYQVEYRVKTKSGEEKWLWEQGIVILEKDIPKHIEGFITDITIQKNALLEIESFNDKLQDEIKKKTTHLLETNEELKQQTEEINTNLAYIEEINQSLHEKTNKINVQNEKLTLLNNELIATEKAINAAAIVSITDLKGTILDVNDKFCEISLYSKGELLGQNQNIVSSHFHPKSFWIKMWKTISSGNVWRGEIKNKKKNGEPYWVDTVIAPFIGKNGKPYQYMAIRFLITDRKTIERELKDKNYNITQSIEYAKHIQNAIIPGEGVLKPHFKDSFILYKPKDIVSGDFIWFWHDANFNKSYLASVDCTGHGVPGAFMSLLGYELLDHIIISRGIHRPDIVLEEKDKAVRRLLDQDKEGGNNDGMDMSLIVIDHLKKELKYSGANNSFFIIRNEELIEIKPSKISIGSSMYGVEKLFQLEKIQLKENDTIYLFSDGYPDQLGGQHQKKFMKGAFKKLLKEIVNHPMSEQKKILWDEHLKWRKDFFQIDDITIVGIKM